MAGRAAAAARHEPFRAGDVGAMRIAVVNDEISTRMRQRLDEVKANRRFGGITQESATALDGIAPLLAVRSDAILRRPVHPRRAGRHRAAQRGRPRRPQSGCRRSRCSSVATSRCRSSSSRQMPPSPRWGGGTTKERSTTATGSAPTIRRPPSSLRQRSPFRSFNRSGLRRRAARHPRRRRRRPRHVAHGATRARRPPRSIVYGWLSRSMLRHVAINLVAAVRGALVDPRSRR